MARMQHGGLGMLWFALAATAMIPAQAQTANEIVLHSFGAPPNGAHPSACVISRFGW